MILTKRDCDLLNALKKYELLTTAMLGELIFKGIRKTTILRRLRILEQEKFITRFQHTTSQIHLWSITDLVARKLGLDANKNSWNKNTLDHDLKIIELRLKLEKLNFVQGWTTEQEIKSLVFRNNSREAAKKKLIPDGLFISSKETQNKSIAVELEMTLKEKNRIKEVIKNYLAKKDLNFVWYISNHKNILKNMFLLWKDMAKNHNGTKLIGSLYDEVIVNPIEATIYTLEGAFKFHEFWKLSPAHTYAHCMSTQWPQSSIQNQKINAINYSASSRESAF